MISADDPTPWGRISHLLFLAWLLVDGADETLELALLALMLDVRGRHLRRLG